MLRKRICIAGKIFLIVPLLLLWGLCACGAPQHSETTSLTEPGMTVTVPSETATIPTTIPTEPAITEATPSEPTTVPTTAPADPVLSDPKPLEPMAVETLDPDAFGGINGVIIYEDADNFIFYTDYGLFDYDLVERKITHSFDFMKAYGRLGATQGEDGTYASASADGTKIVIHFIFGDEYFDACYLDLTSMTWQTGAFRDLDVRFDRYNLVKGYVYPCDSHRETFYERDGKTWYVFAEYFECIAKKAEFLSRL